MSSCSLSNDFVLYAHGLNKKTNEIKYYHFKHTLFLQLSGHTKGLCFPITIFLTSE